MTLEEQIEAIVDKRIAEKQEPLKQELAVANRILAKIPLRVSTAEALAMTGIKTPQTLDKHFTRLQNGTKGRLTYSLVEIERWIAERELIKAA